jgi:galactokinase
MAERLLATWAPGRVNLIGEHTDYSGGLALPAAIQHGITVEVTARSSQISLYSTASGPTEPFAADGGGPAAIGWARFGQAVAAELAALGRPPVGLEATIDSTLPAGSGLSSSAALEVSLALALCAVADFELEPLALALACQRAERRAVGVPCGILDQAASVLGRRGAAILLDCGTLEHRPVPIPEGAALVVVDSGVQRTLAGSDYARRRSQLERALQLVGVERSTEVERRDLDGLDRVSEHRLRHVTTENERVLRFARALELGDLEAAGELLCESHASLRDDYEVSIPELDLLVALSRAAGAYGARLVGAGFGGSVLALTDADRAARVADRIAHDYRLRTRRPERAMIVQPSSGARRLSS